LVDVYGIEAVVKADLDGGASSEMRAFYSGLIQRAARFNKKNGDGSVTLILVTNFPAASGYDEDDENTVFSVQDFSHLNGKLKERLAILEKKQIPLTPSNLRKINIPLPIALDADRARLLALQNVDDLISMTDGQIWLDERLFAKGQRPAMDPQRSITRVGIGADTDSRADAPIIRKIVGGLRFEFAQALSLDGSAIGANVDKQLLKRDAYLSAMKQNSGEVRRLSENSVLLLAASIGGLDSVAQKDKPTTVQEYIVGLLRHVETQLPTIMSNIDVNMDATPSELEELRNAILQYASKSTK
jgi:F0F1-type ATP synthase alpha subunit